MESVRTYQQTVDKVQNNPGILPLVAEHRKDMQAMITRGMSLRWEFFVNAFDTRQQVAALLPAVAATASSVDLAMREGRHGAYVRELASAISLFQDRTDSLLDMYAEVTKVIDNLSTCSYTSQAFEALLSKVQKVIDTLNLEGYANLDKWVENVEHEIERALLQRLLKFIDIWVREFSKSVSEDGNKHLAGYRSLASSKTANTSVLHIEPSKHEIRIKNQVIYLDPPVEAAKTSWYAHLQEWLGVVCHLPRLQSAHQEIGLKTRKPSLENTTYISLVSLLARRAASGECCLTRASALQAPARGPTKAIQNY